MAEAGTDGGRTGVALAAGIALGLSVVAVVGLGAALIVHYMRIRRLADGAEGAREGLAGAMGGWALNGAAVPWTVDYDHIRDILRQEMPAPVALPRPRRARAVRNVVAQTYVLPAASSGADGIRVATAAGGPSRVTLRPVGPAGAYVIFAYDPATLNFPSGVQPAGQMGVLPVGQQQTLYLDAGQAVFALGNVASTMLSVSINPQVTDDE